MKTRFLLAVLALGACQRGACEREVQTDETPGLSRAAGGSPPPLSERVQFPLRPPSCGYVVRPPHAGRIQVRRHSEEYGPRPDVRALHLTFVGDPSTSMVVQWSTDERTYASTVRVQEEGGAELPVAEGYSFPLPGATDRRQHEVHLCGLKPSTRYRYVAGGARRAAATHTFTTAPAGAGEVRVAVAGDSRSDPRAWGRVARAMLARRPDAMLFTGDAVGDGGNAALWEAFFAEGADLLAEVPGLWVDGNHEGRAAVYYDQFALPPNGSEEYHEHWYAITYGPLRVIGLNDTTVPKRVIAGVEAGFLRDALASVDRAATPWVVTFHHQPMHTDAVGHRPDTATLSAWGPLFDAWRVDLDLSGHVHNYEASEPLRAGQVVDPTRGTRYVVFGGAGAPLYPFHPKEPWVHARESTHGFGVITASRASMRWEAFRDDGSLLDAIDLSRPRVAQPLEHVPAMRDRRDDGRRDPE